MKLWKNNIRKKAKLLGADLVGFLNLKDYKSPRSPDPHKYLPSAKSIIVLAFRAIANQKYRITWSHMPSLLYTTEVAGNYVVYNLAKYLMDEFKAESFIVQPHRPFELDENTYRAPVGTISLRHSAVQSGIAVWGRNTLVLTKEYGPRILLFGILNSLDIESDQPISDYSPCAKCKYPCVENCPAKAFTEDGKVLSHRCVRYSQQYDSGNFMRFLIEIAGKPLMEERLGMLRSPRFFNHLQYLQQYIYYGCWECTKSCLP